MKYTKQQRIDIAEIVADLYQSGNYTLPSCCQAVGIAYDTLKNWAAPTIDDFDLLNQIKQKELIRSGYIPEVNAIIRQAKQDNEVEYNKLILDQSTLKPNLP